jgi:predicted Zn-dependent protease
MLRLVPNSALGPSILANIYVRKGERERAIDLRKRQIQADPSYLLAYGLLIRDYAELDRFEEAHALAEAPALKGNQSPFVQESRLKLAYIEGNIAEADKIWDEMQRGDPTQGVAVKLNYALSMGRFSDAAKLITLIRDLGDRTGSRSAWRAAMESHAIAKALAGDCSLVQGSANDVHVEAQLYCSESARAAKRAEEIAGSPGANTDVIARARAVAALAKHQPQQAVDALEPVRLVDNEPSIPFHRGLAYLELNKPSEAVAEFRRLTARKSQVLNTVSPAAHVYLARALTAAGNKTEAKKTYEAFFNLWKNCDPGIPLLEKARKEYSALQ